MRFDGSSIPKLDKEAKKDIERQKAKRTAMLTENQATYVTKYSAKTANPKQEQQGRTVKQRKKKPKERQKGPDAAPHTKTNGHPDPIKQRLHGNGGQTSTCSAQGHYQE